MRTLILAWAAWATLALSACGQRDFHHPLLDSEEPTEGPRKGREGKGPSDTLLAIPPIKI